MHSTHHGCGQDDACARQASPAAPVPPVPSLASPSARHRPQRPGAQRATTAAAAPAAPDSPRQRDGRPSLKAPERDFPPAITVAIQRAVVRRDGLYGSLCSEGRLLLCELLRCVSATHPGGAFYIHGQTLCTRLGCSRPTLTRWLRGLREGGWLLREQSMQGAREHGFSISTTRLTPQAQQALGLVTSPAADDEKQVDEALQAPAIAASPSDPDAAVPAPQQPVQVGAAVDVRCSPAINALTGLSEIPSEEEPARKRAGPEANQEEAIGSHDCCDDAANQVAQQRPLPDSESGKEAAGMALCATRRGSTASRWARDPAWSRPPRLPQHLRELTPLLTEIQVCRLMAIAKQRGQRLEHVWQAGRGHIQRSAQPFAYIRSLLLGDWDWRWIASHPAGSDADTERAPGRTPGRASRSPRMPAEARVACCGQPSPRIARESVWTPREITASGGRGHDRHGRHGAASAHAVRALLQPDVLFNLSATRAMRSAAPVPSDATLFGVDGLSTSPVPSSLAQEVEAGDEHMSDAVRQRLKSVVEVLRQRPVISVGRRNL